MTKRNSTPVPRRLQKCKPILPLIARHKSLVEKHIRNYQISEAGCWIWQGATHRSSTTGGKYGTVSLSKTGKVFAHRLSFVWHNGMEIGQRMVRHRCHNSLCVNPEHLILGSHDDNMQDMVNAGRAANQEGELNHKAKLNESDVLRIVSLLPDYNNIQISAMIDGKVKPTTISAIRCGKKWGSLTGL